MFYPWKECPYCNRYRLTTRWRCIMQNTSSSHFSQCRPSGQCTNNYTSILDHVHTALIGAMCPQAGPWKNLDRKIPGACDVLQTLNTGLRQRHYAGEQPGNGFFGCFKDKKEKEKRQPCTEYYAPSRWPSPVPVSNQHEMIPLQEQYSQSFWPQQHTWSRVQNWGVLCNAVFNTSLILTVDTSLILAPN